MGIKIVGYGKLDETETVRVGSEEDGTQYIMIPKNSVLDQQLLDAGAETVKCDFHWRYYRRDISDNAGVFDLYANNQLVGGEVIRAFTETGYTEEQARVLQCALCNNEMSTRVARRIVEVGE